MKKKLSIIALSVITLFATQSCNKMRIDKKHHEHEHTETTETINVDATLNMNGTYSYTLPTNQSDDEYQITSQATRFTTSALSTDALGNIIYTYVPSPNIIATGYTDSLVIANVEEVHTAGNCNHASPKPHFDPEIERTINIHLTIAGTNKNNLDK